MGILDAFPQQSTQGQVARTVQIGASQPQVAPISPFNPPGFQSPFSGPSFQPVVEQNVSNENALLNKITDLRDFYNQLDPHVRNALVQYDASRVSGGAAPLSHQQTIAAATAAQQHQVPIEGTQRSVANVPGNAISDLKSVIGSVPKLLDPRTWIHEIADIPNIPQRIQTAREHGADMFQAVGQAPGIRLIPGSFVFSNLEHPAELARHPLFTALDVLPYANKLAATRPVVTEATRLADVAESALKALPADAPFLEKQALVEAARKVSPLRTVTSRTLNDAGEIVPNAFGQIAQNVAKTPFGQILSTAFGAPSRTMMTIKAGLESRVAARSEGVLPATDAVEHFTQQAKKLAESSGQSREERLAFTTKLQLGDRTLFTPEELALSHQIDTISNEFAKSIQESSGDLQQFKNEWYPRQQAAKIIEARSVADATKRLSILRDEYLNPSGQLTPDDFVAAANKALTNPIKRVAKHELDATLRAADAYGFDMTEARKLLTRTKGRSLDQVSDAVARGTALPPATRIPLQDILTRLQSQPNHTQATALAYAIADGNPTRITQALDNLLSQRNSRLHWLDDPGVVDTLKSYRDRIDWENRYGKKYTSARATRLDTRAQRLVNSTVPARWGPAVTTATRQRVRDELLSRGTTAADVEKITQLVTNANWVGADQLLGASEGFTKTLYSGIEKEVAQTWQQMRDAGIDPVFIHRVSRSQAGTIARPRIGPVPQTITQVNERALDFSPGTEDWAVSLTHQGMELMSHKASEEFIDHMVQRWGVKQSDLQATLSPQEISGQFEKFNPDERGYSWGGGKLDRYRQDVYFIPKALANNLHRIADPKSLLGGVFDPLTRTFRIAVVGLSPRTQLYNILGGSTMVLGQTGPGVFKYMKQAWDMIHHPELIDNEFLRASIGSQRHEFLDTDVGRAQAMTGVLMGKTARRIYDQATSRGPVGAVRKAGNWVVNKSFDLNSLFDDQYRVMAYLYGHDKALTKGLSRATAERAGEDLLRRSMMDWTSMTPIERDVFKTIFPFYGFMRHSIQYVMRYPVDHPLRASVLGAFGKAETDDLHGLPLSFLSMIPIGGESATGHQGYLNLGGVNPFSGVPNLFTIAGYLSATNPVINTALESVGLQSGSAELYPTLQFDPETGRLAAQHSNVLENFAGNVIPQSQLFTNVLGVSHQFNSMLQRDPAAAMRSLISAGGLPLIWRDKNVPQEYFKTEVNRLKSVNTELNAAKTSGDWSAAPDMPTLQAALDNLRSKTPEELAALTPKPAQTLVDQMQMALQSQVAALQGTPGSSASIYSH